MRLLALDLGDRRIGMATGGVPGLPATPIGHLERDTPEPGFGAGAGPGPQAGY